MIGPHLSEDSRSLAARFAFLIKASRPGFWSTSVWFYLLTVSQLSVWESPRFYVGVLYFTFPFGLLLYGWNDIGDRATDSLNPRKDSYLFGARGSENDLARLPYAIAAVQTPFVVLFCVLIGTFPILIWLVALLLANMLYNNRPFRFKSRPGLEMLNQSGYLLVFVLGTWLNHAPALPWQTYLFGALFAMHSHLFGQIMDIEPDGAVGRRTTAVVMGALPSKWLLVAMLVFESGLVWRSFGSLEVSGFLALAALYFTADALILFRGRTYPAALLHLFALGLNFITLGSLGWIWQTGCLNHLSRP